MPRDRPSRPSDRRTRELEIFAESSRLVASTLDPTEVLDRLAALTRTRLGLDLVRVWLRDETTGDVVLAAAAGSVTDEAGSARRRPGEGLVGHVVETGAPLVVADVLNDPRLRDPEWFEAEGIVSFLAVPIALETSLIAVLACMTRTPRDFSQADVALASAIAAPAALAARSAALHAEALERLEEIHAFQRVTSETLSSPDLATAIRAVVREARHLLQADAAFCSLVDHDTGGVELVATSGTRPESFPRVRLPSGEGMAGLIREARRPVRTDDYLADSRFRRVPELDEWARAEGAVSMLGAPVLDSRGDVVALLWAFNRSPAPFTARHEQKLAALAQHATLAINQSRAFEEERRRARETTALLQIARASSSTLELTPLLAEVARRTAEALGFDRCSIFLWREGRIQPVMSQFAGGERRAPGLWRAFSQMERCRVEEIAAFADAVRTQAPVVIPDAAGAGLLPGWWVEVFGLKTVVIVPLISKGVTVGTLLLDGPVEPEATRPDRLGVAMTLAAQVALALENAGLVADLRRTLEELRAAQEGLMRGAALRAVGELAAGAAHHLNNLMAVALGRAQLLLMQDVPEGLRESLKAIERAVVAAAETVRRIQAFARSDSDARREELDLNALIQESLELTRPRWQEESRLRGVGIEASLDPGVVPRVSGRAAEVREVITSLILNAVDAMPSGGRILIRTRGEGERVVVTVRDTGVGMSEEVKRRAFEPFYTTKGVKRTGLGLAVAYGSVRRLGGEIELESAEGRGTTVRFWLPIAGADRVVARAEAPRPPRILAIDDDAAVRDLVADVLTARGYEVTAAGSGREGLARLEAGSYDLVVTDLGMPEVTGWDVLRVVRESHPAVPVLLLTGWGETPEAPRGLRADGLIAKPFDLERLVAAVSDALGARGRGAGVS